MVAYLSEYFTHAPRWLDGLNAHAAYSTLKQTYEAS